METFPLMVDWRSALTTCGAQCVGIIGVIRRQQWSAGSWAMTPTVSVWSTFQLQTTVHVGTVWMSVMHIKYVYTEHTFALTLGVILFFTSKVLYLACLLCSCSRLQVFQIRSRKWSNPLEPGVLPRR